MQPCFLMTARRYETPQCHATLSSGIRPKCLHISEIEHHRVVKVSDHLNVGDPVNVKLVKITPEGKLDLSRKALLPRPEGMPAEEPREHRERRSGPGGPGGGPGRDKHRGDRKPRSEKVEDEE